MDLFLHLKPLKLLTAERLFLVLGATIFALISLPSKANSLTDVCSDYAIGETRSFDFDGRQQNLGEGPSLTTVQTRHEVRKTAVDSYEIHFLIRLVKRTDLEKDQMANRIRSCAEKASQYMISPSGIRLQLIPHFSHWGEQTDTSAREVAVGVATGRNHSQGYTDNIPCTTIVHELLHLAGLVDEYEELSIRSLLFGSTAPYDCRSLGPKTSVMSHQHHGFNKASGVRKVLIQHWQCQSISSSGRDCPPGKTMEISHHNDDWDDPPGSFRYSCRDAATHPAARSNFCSEGQRPVLSQQFPRNTLFRDVESAETGEADSVTPTFFSRWLGGPRTVIDTTTELITQRNLVIFDFDAFTLMDLYTEGYMIYDVKYWNNSPSLLQRIMGWEFVPITRVESYKTVVFADVNENDIFESPIHNAHARQILFPNCMEKNPVYLTCSPNAYRTSNIEQCLEVPEICSHPTEWLQ